MQRLAHLRNSRHSFNHAIRHVIRMGADETDTLDAVDAGNGPQQIGESMLPVPVRIHRLPQQCDLACAFGNSITNFGKDLID